MNTEYIIRMAREAGLVKPSHPFNPWGASQEALERFAVLVAAAEREACAKVLDRMAENDKLSNYFKVAAFAIRERGAP